MTLRFAPTFVGLAGLLALACQPHDFLPEVARTEHLVIGLDPDAPGELCEGDVRQLDIHASRLADMLGTDIRGPIHINLWHERVPSGACQNPNALGCFQLPSRLIEATATSWDHELVHALMHETGRPKGDFFFEEGVAEALSTAAQAGPTSSYPISAFLGGEDDESRDMSAHFMAWAIAEYGSGGLTALRSTGSPTQAFRDWTGESLATAEALYRETAAYAYPNPWGCGEVLEPDPDGTFTFEDELSCSGELVSAWGESVLHTCRAVTLSDPAVYTFTFSPGLGTLQRCLVEPQFEYDNPGVHASVPSDYHVTDRRLFLPGATEVPVELTAGTYRMCVYTLSQDPETVTMEAKWTEYVSLPVPP